MAKDNSCVAWNSRTRRWTMISCGTLVLLAASATYFSSCRRYSGVSHGGIALDSCYKENQDGMLMILDKSTSTVFLAVLDGHGPAGRRVSQGFETRLAEEVFNHPEWATCCETAITESITKIEVEVLGNAMIDTTVSGTTLVSVCIRGTQLTVTNVGDSRAVLGRRQEHQSGTGDSSPTTLVAQRLTEDHKPDVQREEVVARIYGEGVLRMAYVLNIGQIDDSTYNVLVEWVGLDEELSWEPAGDIDHDAPRFLEDKLRKMSLSAEERRILAAGGRVSAVKCEDEDVGPPRVWLGDRDAPGLAMSRSLGDSNAKAAGIISESDVFRYELADGEGRTSGERTGSGGGTTVAGEPEVLILATDGLWEVFSDQEAVDTVSRCEELSEAIPTLVTHARERWLEQEQMADDITVCVARFKARSKWRKVEVAAARQS